MKRMIQKGFAHAGVFVVIAVVAIGGVLVWVYLNKSSQLATSNNTQPVTTTSQAVSSTRQVKTDVEKLNIDSDLNTSDIDAVLQ